ncbi:MAG: helix-turn-helix domain-containing protein [Hyphomicrobium sp.]|uniref:helix-turn-helix domain-containing protein n=1 Tax=Hyphomicrobium sp. TaxID=82 RepID=UPI003D11CE5C
MAGPRSSALADQIADASRGDDLLRAVGKEIRDLRKSRGMTLTELADRAGMSVSFLSQVERSISNPSVLALYEISRALGVNISWFFANGAPGPQEERDYVVRACHRRKVAFDGGAIDELLSPNLNGQLELLLSRLPPGSMSGERPYTHSGEEGGMIVAGQLELWIGNKHFVLNEGDSFTFPSNLPHRYGNPGRTETVVLWAITPPSY